MQKPGNRLVEREFVLGGISAGLLGGGLMAALEVGISYSMGHGLFAPLILIDEVVGGSSYTGGNTALKVALGFAILLGISACLGGIFAICLRLLRRLSGMIDAAWFGLAFGTIVWGATRNVMLLPNTDGDLGAALAISPEKWFLAHVVFGATLGLTPVVAQWFYRGEAEEEQDHRKDLAA